MVKSPRQKGNRTVRRAVEFYGSQGYLVDRVEKTGRWIVDKDLFSLFDLIGIRKNEVVLIQVKTNQPPTQSAYVEFAQKYSGTAIRVEAFTWYDRMGYVIHQFFSDGSVTRIDRRDNGKKN